LGQFLIGQCGEEIDPGGFTGITGPLKRFDDFEGLPARRDIMSGLIRWKITDQNIDRLTRHGDLQY